jgi:tripartite-type tricarboxylate transporter receptor subunit TctC
MRKMWIVALAAALAIGTIQTGRAQPAAKYPTKAITVIHGFKPGGGSDQLAQLTGPFLEKVVKQQWVNVYKPGADGAIAWKEVGKNAKPDGYTLTTVLTPKTQLNALVLDNAGYAMNDFEPIANMVFDPGILVVAVNSKFKTVKDLVDAAKKDPGAVTMAHSGNGGDDWFNGVMIERLTGSKFNLVPFEGDGPATQAAAGEHVDSCTSNISLVIPLLKAGKLRALAVYTEQRLPAAPEVPTLKELGINLVEGSYRGYLAPKGTPREIVDTLADAMEKVASDPEYRKLCESNNLLVDFKKGDVNRKWLQEQNEKLTKIAQDMGLAKK